MRIEMWPVGKPIPYEKNPRINDKAVDAVAASLKEFGFQQPIVVDDNGVVIVGHTRLKAAKKMGLESVPVHVASGLSPEQIQAYRIADNQTATIADWDLPVLVDEIKELVAADYDVGLLGFDQKTMDEMLGSNEKQEEEAEIPEPPADPITENGDIWILGDHRVMCGDSTDAGDVALLMDGGRAEMMFTDPPYGVDYEGGHFNPNRQKLKGDDTTGLYAAFLPVAMKFVDGPCYLWFAGSKALPVYQAVDDCGGVISALLIWHKTNATYAAMNAQYKQRHEPCLYFKPKTSTLRWVGPSDACTIWEFKRDGKNDLHPTQKPVCLAENALKNHKAASVADFFSGSGSTVIAAENLGRKCYGMEISPQYVDVIVRRWMNHTGKQAVTLSGKKFQNTNARRN